MPIVHSKHMLLLVVSSIQATTSNIFRTRHPTTLKQFELYAVALKSHFRCPVGKMEMA